MSTGQYVGQLELVACIHGTHVTAVCNLHAALNPYLLL